MGRRGGAVPRMAMKSATISSLVSATEKPLFLAATGNGAGGCSSACPPPAAAAAFFPAASDLDASGATVAERRVRRFQGRDGREAPPAEVSCPFSGDGVCGCFGGEAEAGAESPFLEQRRRRWVPQPKVVGKEKLWRRVRVAEPAGGAAEGEDFACAVWWSEAAAEAEAAEEEDGEVGGEEQEERRGGGPPAAAGDGPPELGAAAEEEEPRGGSLRRRRHGAPRGHRRGIRRPRHVSPACV